MLGKSQFHGSIYLNVLTAEHTVTFQKFKYNFRLFQVYHVISAKCYTFYSKKSLFNTLDTAVIRY